MQFDAIHPLTHPKANFNLTLASAFCKLMEQEREMQRAVGKKGGILRTSNSPNARSRSRICSIGEENT
jgi:hypothetical protein